MGESESDILVSRFRSEQRARVAADLRREDDLLRKYIDVGKLDFWFQELLSSVESQVSSVSIARTKSGPDTNLHSVDPKARLTWV
jgi:nuclear pore complex protein Nup133